MINQEIDEELYNSTNEEVSTPEDKLLAYMEIAKENERKYTYARADLENVRRQSAIKISNAREEAIKDVIKTLLPIIDDFERALEYDKQEGYEIIYNKFINILKSLDIEEINPTNCEFDDETMEAVTTIPCATMDDNQVFDCTQKGYKRGTSVLRYAKVVVVKNI